MIQSLYIKNYVLIQELKLDFKSGFSVFTGETGAGKSILIDAIGLLMGNRFSTDLIRKGSTKAIIEGVFTYRSKQVNEILVQFGFDQDDQLIITRELDAEGRSVNRINQRAVNLSVLKEISEYLVDIHNQHDTQYLLKNRYHLTLLDAFESEDAIVGDVKLLYQAYARLVDEKKHLEQSQYNPNDLEFLQFQIQEIEEANLQPLEDEELETQQKLMMSFEKISSRLKTALENFDEQEGVVEKYYEALKQLKTIDEMNDVVQINDQLNDLYFQVSEKVAELKSIYQNLNYDEDSFNYIQERLFTINRLKKKYGRNIEAIFESLKTYKSDVDRIEHRHQHLEALTQQINQAYQLFYQKAQVLSHQRQAKANRLEASILKQCQDLYLEKAQFSVDFKQHEGSISGIDDVEFLISMNPGESLKPLSKVASGGELSRLMLGLKVIFNQVQSIETVIFDEIDSGVSGRIASAIGLKMHKLGASAQVFSVTHLGQVAAHASSHYYVEKIQDEASTQTLIKELDVDQRIEELSLISSGTKSEQSLKAAKELLSDSQLRIQST